MGNWVRSGGFGVFWGVNPLPPPQAIHEPQRRIQPAPGFHRLTDPPGSPHPKTGSQANWGCSRRPPRAGTSHRIFDLFVFVQFPAGFDPPWDFVVFFLFPRYNKTLCIFFLLFYCFISCYFISYDFIHPGPSAPTPPRFPHHSNT